MAEITWDAQAVTDTGFTHSVLPTYVIKKLLIPPQYYGDPAPFGVSGEIDERTGETARWVRYRPLARPRANASSVTLSTPLDLVADKVEATLEYWEAFTRFTTRADFYLGHPIFEVALAKHNELFHRTGRLNIFDILLAGTNTFFGGGQTAIGGLGTTDNDVGDRARKIVTQFRRVGAMPSDGRYYPAFCNPDIIDILMDDNSYTDAESFQGRGLYDMEVPAWRGATWYPTNLLPIRQLQAAIASPTSGASGGALSDDEYFFKIVAVNPLTGQTEYVTAETSITLSGGGAVQTIVFVMPAATAIELETNTNYVYDIYIGLTTGDANLYQQTTYLSNAAAATVTISTALTTTGNTAPVTPASGVKVTPVIFLAHECYGNTSSKLFPYGKFRPSIVSPTPTIGNDLGLLRSVGWSLDQKAVILNQNFMAVLWIGYS